MVFACLLELFVDRNYGAAAHRQRQQEEGSAHVSGAWVHVADVRRAYDKGFVGTLRIFKPQFEFGMRSLKQN